MGNIFNVPGCFLQETAINVAFSCQLLDEKMKIVTMNADSKVGKKMAEERRKLFFYIFFLSWFGGDCLFLFYLIDFSIVFLLDSSRKRPVI